jgi:hypothetical protein
MEDEIPPTTLCLTLRPYLSLLSSLSLGLFVLRLPSQPSAALFSLSIFIIGLQSTYKTLKMHLVSVFFFAVFLAALVDCLTLLKEMPTLGLRLTQSHWLAVMEAIAMIGAPVVSVASLVVAGMMLRDYAAAVEARMREERRGLIAAVAGEQGYGGLALWSGRGRRLEE